MAEGRVSRPKDVEGVIGAGRHGRTLDRATYRNGYRDRSLDTRLGSLQLRIPKLCQGSYLGLGLRLPRSRGRFVDLGATCRLLPFACWLRRPRANGSPGRNAAS